MSRTITPLIPSNTFQDWYDKTNETASAFAHAVTIGDAEINSGNVIISGQISSSEGLKADLINSFSNANSINIDVSTITLEGEVFFGQSFSLARNAEDTAITLARGTKSLTIDTTLNLITAENLTVDNDILPADLSANTFNSVYGRITLNQFPIDANDYDITNTVTYGSDGVNSFHRIVGTVSVLSDTGARGMTTTDVTGNVTGNTRGNVLATDQSVILENGSTDQNAWLKADVVAYDDSIVIENSSTRDSVKIVAGTIQGTTVTATTGFVGNLTGNVTGDLKGNIKNSAGTTIFTNGTAVTSAQLTGNVIGNVTGDVTGNVIGDVKAPNGALILDTGDGSTIPAEYVGNVIGDVTGDLTGNVTGDLTGNTLGIHYGDVYRQDLSSSYDKIVDVSARAFIGNIHGETIGMVLQNEEGGRSWYKGDIRASNGSVVLNSGTNGSNATFTGDAAGDHTGSFTGDVTVPAGSTFVLEGNFAPPENFYTVPRGGIIMWSGSISSIPDGWALCDGGSYTYNNYTTNTPNLIDRFIVGAGSSYGVGDTGGANSVALTASQMPSHRHTSGSLHTNTAGSHTHQIYANDRGNYESQLDGVGAFRDDAERLLEDWRDTIRPAGSHSHSISGSTGYEGSGQAHENRPPYYALAFIIRL